MRTPVLAFFAAAALALPATASAATTINGSLGAALFGITTSNPTSAIGAGTTFSNLFTLVSSSGGQFSTIPVATIFSLSPVKATVSSAVNFSGAFGSYAGTVTSVASQSAAVTLKSLGTFTPLGALSGYSAGPASVTFTFNQTGGAGTSVSGSFTLASPPVPSPVPEPGVWVMMISGAGLAGAIARRRRQKAKTDA